MVTLFRENALQSHDRLLPAAALEDSPVLDRWVHYANDGGAALVAVLSMALAGGYIVVRSGPLAEGLLAAAGVRP